MSHSFYIASIPDLQYPDIVDSLGIPDIVLADKGRVSSDGRWPVGVIYPFIDNLSTRPIEVDYDGRQIRIRIFQASCLQDYEFALRLTRRIASARSQSITPEDNERMTLADFEKHYDREWARQHCQTMVDMLFGMQKKHDTVLKLAGTRSELNVGPRFVRQVEAEGSNWQSAFFERFRRLNYIDREDVFVASILHLQNRTQSRKVTTQVWGEGVETLLSDTADTVTLRSAKGHQSELSFENFVEAVSTSAIWLSENRLLVPGLTGKTWRTCFKKCKRFQPQDLFDLGRDTTPDEADQDRTKRLPLSSYINQMSSEERLCIMSAPLCVFLLVALADGVVTQRERRAFVAALKTNDNELLQAAMEHLDGQEMSLIATLMENPARILPDFKAAIALADDKLPQAYALPFKIELFNLAKGVAKASTGIFRIGSSLRDSEQRVLNMIVLILNPPG